MADEFKRLTITEVRARLRAAVDEAGGQKGWAVAHGLSETTVSEVLRGTRQPGPRVLGPLGLLRLETSYAASPFGASVPEARA